MSNLSDLLPAGGGAKVITATADGNLATGQAVALQSNGTVTTIGPQGSAAGSEVVFESADSSYQAIAFDSNSNKIVIAYQDAGNSNYGTAIVGTVSGLSISFGTPVVFESSNSYYISAAFDASVNRVVIAYADAGNSSSGTVIMGNVVGDSITFSSPSVYNSGTTTYNSIVYDSSQNNVVIAYRDESNSSYGTAIVGDVNISGNSIAFGSEVVFESANTTHISATFDSNENKVVIAYKDGPNSNYGTAIVGTVSGTSISFGTAAVFESANTFYISATFDSFVNKTVIAYTDGGNSARGTAVVATVSGTSISFGTPVAFETSSTEYSAATFDSVNNKVVIAYKDNTVDKGEAIVGTVSGTSISFDTAVQFDSDRPDWVASVFDSNAKAVVIAYKDTGNSNYGTANVFKVVDDNSRDFAGITNQAINNSASGEVVVEGGVITNGSLLPQTYSASFGSEVVFESADTQETAITYDTTNDKIVIFYRDGGNSDYGTAVVGTVSGTSISFGTPVVYQSAATEYNAATFDSANGKVVVACKHQTAAAGKVYVGTVSGTSISFGSSVEFEGGNTTYISATYDSANGKVVLSFVDESDGSKGKARVGTVSGTSISFGSETTFNNANTVFTSITYDSNAGKVLIAFRDAGNSNYGTGIVGTVSGTSISFGSETVFESARSDYIVSAYDSSANKVVIVYADDGNSDYITSVVATVSGTSVSFGTPVVVSSSAVTNPIGVAYDSNSNKTFVTYQDGSNNNYGAYALGTVSGTSISFTSSAYWAEVNATKNQTAVYDPDQQKVVIAFRDGGNSNYGTGVVGTVSGAYPNLVPNTTYYVQTDGTLSTTSSSVTAGKAIANTTLLLKG